ncbi:MAG: pitrilysin family protein [Melioribacteraceae bacterium]|nr:pitrilysin family protein [Melioribacteraceae bacterium]
MKKKLIIFLLMMFTLILYSDSKNIEFIEYDLDNGLHVILHQDKTTPIVAVSIMYHVGSKNEDPERTGFAHFFEHLMFEGSEHIPRGEYFNIVQGNGGTLNANTSFDRTFYYQILPSNQLKLGLWLESERLLHLKIDSIGVETQRNVVKEERKQRIDNQPYGSLLEELFSRAYTTYPYRWTPIGSNQYIDLATLDEFIEFYKTYYVPQNATLSIAGDIDIEETKELVDLYFGDIPRGTNEITRPTVKEPPMTEEIRDTVYDNIQLPAVIQSYRIPEQGTDDYYAINMLTTLLSGGQSSRMYKALVDEKQLALQAASIPLSLEYKGQFINFGLSNAGVEPMEVEEAMDIEIGKVQNELISDREFEKLQNQIESNFVQSNSTVAGISESLANYHVYFGDANLINTELQKYMDVTKEDIKRVANEYLRKENRVVLYYLPKSQAPEEKEN